METQATTHSSKLEMNRRRFIGYFSAIGLGGTLLPGALTAVAQGNPKVTTDMVRAAADMSGLNFTQEQLESIADGIGGFKEAYAGLRTSNLGNATEPAVIFNPIPAQMKMPAQQLPIQNSNVKVSRPKADQDLAFLPVTHLAHLIKSRQVTSTELTKLYLSRLKKHNPTLLCAVTITEELALKQARQADKEIAAGNYRGVLHGIPWGLKDIFAVKDYKTTWGASPFKNQTIDLNASVYEKLTAAGAVLVAKLSTGALASGADWYGGTTRNPWNPKLNAYGSSAGPASATAAGLVGFAIGTETGGSIVSPAAACGLAGLRPTFGRISKYGCMALSWSLDNIGPLCRSVEDCAIVFDALRGADGKDNSVIDAPFNWDGSTDLSGIKIGLWNTYIDRENPVEENHELSGRLLQETQRQDKAALDVLRSLGAELVPFNLPQELNEAAGGLFGLLFNAESAAAFDDLTRNGNLDIMRNSPENSGYPDSLRQGRFIPAVEYLQANQKRTHIMQEMYERMSEVDMVIGTDIFLTNITGQPEISIPHGFYSEGIPTTFRLTGKLLEEDKMLKVAHAFQSVTDYHLQHPKL